MKKMKANLISKIKDRYTIEDLLTICHILEKKKDTIYNNKILEIKSLEEKN